ncbi:hypothetical protein BB559_005203 [Furculomyces boomerangus]|uniref:Nudix hydrolase domain-containing protein n=2 Tax=Harpellales TaxID=61421 RepID=A0A2T9YA29_9FUNG|nr:hypothetical protein BB559_005203 [Furculomyces boomerangus]PVZ98415.1 hypothetical protein BB558_005585 [Smittium angustum]
MSTAGNGGYGGKEGNSKVWFQNLDEEGFERIERRLKNFDEITKGKYDVLKGNIKYKRYENEIREAAVVVLLCNVRKEACLVFEERSKKLNSYKGQISFPGGKIDAGESVLEAALRETWEEIGIEQSQIRVLGGLPPVPGRRLSVKVHPVVGVVEGEDFDVEKLRVSEGEVHEVFTLPLAWFLENSGNKVELPTMSAMGYNKGYLSGKAQPIWGLTAYITNMFIDCMTNQSQPK